MWAERRMVEINIAFEEALSLSEYGGNGADVSGEREKLEDVRKLIGLGELVAARRALMRVSTRSAEWNYLFGAVLFRLGEMEKAVLYFGIAARQKPDNEVYRSAYLSAETVRNRENRRSFNRLLGAVRRRSGRREP